MRKRMRTAAGVLLALCLWMLQPVVALAADGEALRIGPQPLGSALQSLAAQAGIQILFPAEAVAGLETPGLEGRYTPEQALRRLLAGTGLGFRATAAGSYAVGPGLESAAAAPGAAPGAQRLITVTATRTEREVIDVPASVSVVTAEEIARQHAAKPEDLLRSLPGVDLTYMSGSAAAGIPVLRGLGQSFAGTTTQSLLNGMPVEPLAITRRYLWYAVSPESIDRIEVVRGPGSVLYGPSAMGGVINVITKRGAGEPFARISAGAGSHAARGLSLSAGGTAGDFDLFLAASAHESDGFVQLTGTPPPWRDWFDYDYRDLDGRDSRERKVSARLTWWPGEATDLALGVHHFENEGAVLGGHPNYRIEQEGTLLDAALNHHFAGGQLLKAKLAYSDVSAPRRTYDYYEYLGTLEEFYHDREDEESFSAELQLDFHPLEGNTLTLGGVWWDGRWSSSEYGPDGELWGEMSHRSRTYGLFAQDEHRFDRLTLTLGGRYDIYEHYDYEAYGTAKPDADDAVFTPRAGLSYRLRDGLALYASAGTAYIPAPNSLKYRSGGMWADNPDLEPETAVSYETGLKFESLAGFLDGSAALYHTTFKDKIARGEVETGTGTKSQFQNLGETRVLGFELELNTRLGRYWQPFFNYTYTDSEITENPSDPALEGNRTANTPRHKFNIGLAYDNPELLTAQVIGRYVGERYFEDSNAGYSRADSHFLADVKLSRSFRVGAGPEWVASLAVDNVFDGTGYGFWYERLDGRSWWLELAARF
ncbi:outer membrane receptor for ferrienterochelin and colicin [Thioalbus denitrificans]|uniref:Outer membrane receptor for ferrienterochelin and colicin n=2 Tax=Thioalbus denitrificans TaxID=547122 RepID=A0A369C0K6_9GAMM|nr:outer membrane receptor for ferrienterochelin and colicin [Thioalbus denitrificans]